MPAAGPLASVPMSMSMPILVLVLMRILALIPEHPQSLVYPMMPSPEASVSVMSAGNVNAIVNAIVSESVSASGNESENGTSAKLAEIEDGRPTCATADLQSERLSPASFPCPERSACSEATKARTRPQAARPQVSFLAQRAHCCSSAKGSDPSPQCPCFAVLS